MCPEAIESLNLLLRTWLPISKLDENLTPRVPQQRKKVFREPHFNFYGKNKSALNGKLTSLIKNKFLLLSPGLAKN